MEGVLKTLSIVLVASAAIAATAAFALAQDVVPIRPNYRGEASCPSNYVIRGNACVSIYAGRERYEGRDRYEGRYRERYRGRKDTVEPRINYRGQLQCPSNYVIRGGTCVSIY